jgi:hypothetical protein
MVNSDLAVGTLDLKRVRAPGCTVQEADRSARKRSAGDRSPPGATGEYEQAIAVGPRSTVAPASKGGRDAPAEVLGGFREPVERAWCMSAEGSVTMISNRPHRTRAWATVCRACCSCVRGDGLLRSYKYDTTRSHYFHCAHATDDHLATRSHAPRCPDVIACGNRCRRARRMWPNPGVQGRKALLASRGDSRPPDRGRSLRARRSDTGSGLHLGRPTNGRCQRTVEDSVGSEHAMEWQASRDSSQPIGS